MTFFTIKLFFKKTWMWVKKNWKATALLIWSLLIWIFSRRSSKAAIDMMKANKESYEAQIRSLKQQRNIERDKIEKLHLKYQEALDIIEKKYNKKEKDLTFKEKKKVKEMVKKAKEKPVEIDRKIENIFGFVSDN